MLNKGDDKKEPRQDYTNLQDTYKRKILVFLGLAGYVCLVSWGNRREILNNSIIYLMGVVFDYSVISKVNKGPKLGWCVRLCHISEFVILFIVMADVLLVMSGGSFGDRLDAHIGYLNLAANGIFGFLAPFTELRLNKPNDD